MHPETKDGAVLVAVLHIVARLLGGSPVQFQAVCPPFVLVLHADADLNKAETPKSSHLCDIVVGLFGFIYLFIHFKSVILPDFCSLQRREG